MRLKIRYHARKPPSNRIKRILVFGFLAGIIVSIITFFVYGSILISGASIIAVPVIVYLYFYSLDSLKKLTRLRKMENAFPDFLQLMSSNLRAGITIDRSILLSVREEFDPLDKEIQQTGREIATGKEIELALIDMSKRIGSDKIRKNVLILISGIRAGGNIATLLDETSVNMREREFIEKRAASNVLMYVIFIFLAVSFGAPALFSLSSVLVETLSHLLSGLPSVENAAFSAPFTLTGVSISPVFIRWFSVFFIIASCILASLILGLVGKGDEREGLKYLLPMIAIGLTVFFVIRLFLQGYLLSIFGGT